ncbi:DMT family transporter [Chloroflexota bacterium]|nr:DMT family transporter [Chloroflexota bacterium]
MTEKIDTTKQHHPVLATLAGIIFVSTASLFIRFAQAEASSLVIAAARLTVASLVLVPMALIRNKKRPVHLSWQEWGKGLLAGLFLALHFASWITSLEYTSIASSVVLVTTTPLWVALLSPMVLKEKIRQTVWIGLVISVVGGVIVGLANACQWDTTGLTCQAQGFTGQAMWGNALALFGAWMAAGYMLMGRQLRKKLDTISYTTLVYGTAAGILLGVLIIKAEPVFSYNSKTYLWLLALGIIPQLLGHSLLNWALKYISAAYVSLTLLGEPIGTSILAYIFLRESPTLLEGAGAVLVLVGIAIGSVRRTAARASEA